MQKLEKKSSREQLAEQVGESHEQIRKHIRLTNLVPELLDMVDEGKVAMRPAVELSYLSEEEQRSLVETIECEDCTPSHVQAIKMRNFSKEGKLNEDVILSIMQEEKPNQREKIILRDERVRRLLPKDLPVSKREEYIIAALTHYAKVRKDQSRSDI